MSGIQDEAYSEAMDEIARLKGLISELLAELDQRIDWDIKPLRGDLIQRAKKECGRTKG